MTTHKILNADSRNMAALPNRSVNLIVTSPPYPMIEMWDTMFFKQDKEIDVDFQNNQYDAAYHKMHEVLSATWLELMQVCCAGMACVDFFMAA